MLSARPTHSSISSRSRIAVAHAFSILSSQRAGRSAGVALPLIGVALSLNRVILNLCGGEVAFVL